MTVKELKKLLESVPDDMEVVISGEEYFYRRVGKYCKIMPAEKRYGQLTLPYFTTDGDCDVFWIDDGIF